MPFVAASRVNGNVTALTASITPSGSNRAVYVAIQADTIANLTSVTCGGNAMTLHSTQAGGYFGATARIYKIAAPSASTQNVVANFSVATTAAMIVVAVDDADQTDILRTAAGGTGGAGPASLAVTSVSGDTVIDTMWALDATVATVGASQTERATPQTLDGNNARFVASTEIATGTSTTMSWTMTGSSAYTHVAAAVIPAAGGGPPDAPSSLTRTSAVGLAWTLPGTGAARTSVRLERRNPATSGTYATLATLAADAVSYNDTTALNGVQYQYRVFAVNGAGDSTASNELILDFTGGGGSGLGSLFGGDLVS